MIIVNNNVLTLSRSCRVISKFKLSFIPDDWRVGSSSSSGCPVRQAVVIAVLEKPSSGAHYIQTWAAESWLGYARSPLDQNLWISSPIQIPILQLLWPFANHDARIYISHIQDRDLQFGCIMWISHSYWNLNITF